MHKLLSALKNALVGDGENNRGFNAMGLVDAFASACDEISRLAAQIRLHADTAPYPQFADDLRRMASEKQADADRLRKWPGFFDAPKPRSAVLSSSGKNHWERMTRDLQAQKSFNAFLQRLEVQVADQDREMAKVIAEIAAHQVEHQKTLTRLVVLADPQANQT
jgi:hypothetical protein